jgi:Tol biopolymer transport system component
VSGRRWWSLVIWVALVIGCGTSQPPSDSGPPSGSPPDAAPSTAATSAAPSSSAAATTPDPLEVLDGEPWLAYQWLAGGGEGIFLARLDGTGAHRLVADQPGSQIHPDWSPDGQRIAFVRFTPEDRSELWLVDADGTDAERLLTCELPCNSFGMPDWSADGSTITFSRDADVPPGGGPPVTFEIAQVDVTTGETTTILRRTEGGTVEEPRLSPDGTQVAYMRVLDAVDSSQGSAIFVADVGSSEERQLTDWDGYGAYPDWTSDGRIVFTTYDLGLFQATSESSDLYAITVDDAGLLPLTDLADAGYRATQPRWAPDGSGIIYTKVDRTTNARTAAFLPLEGATDPLSGPPIIATHAVLRPVP